MVERRVEPRHRTVANRTIRREAHLGMVWIRRLLVILQVTAGAVLGDVRVIVVHVTTGAGHVDVRASQRKPGERPVIEVHLQPRRRVVAG